MRGQRCSVIIPSYRNPAALRRCLAGLTSQHQGDGFEVVVVDNGSDGSTRAAADVLPSARFISVPERQWPAAARNLGVGHAHGELLLFTDADCVPEPGWVRAGASALAEGARMAGGPVLDLRPHHPVAASDNLLQFSECGIGRPAGPAVRVPSCNLAIHRGDFERLGGFAEELRAGEDTALSGKASKLWPEGLWFVPEMRVRHEGRAGLSVFLAHQLWFGHSRGTLRNDLTPTQQRLAARSIMLPAVVVKRLGYILGRSAAWHPGGLPRALLLSPLLVAGLSAYALGLRRGLRQAPAPSEPW